MVGCRLRGGAACSDSQAQSIDNTRTIYAPGTATYVAKVLAAGATCTDVRTALP